MLIEILLLLLLSTFAIAAPHRPPSLIIGATESNLITTPHPPVFNARNVSFDERAILIDGKRQLLQVATIHYPRSTPAMWPKLFRSIREAGLNAIDTYVFWNLHEEERGEYDFEGPKDLRKFIQLANEEGLYVVLRIGPYVCAEWNYGGMPYWLREIPGIDFRTFNEPFMTEMARFIRFTVDYVEDLFYTNGGPIILLQVENEYGLVEQEYGQEGHVYIEWAAEFAKSLTSQLPWFVCVQDNVANIINTCNGFYCDSWLAQTRQYPQQPPMFTENWSGWFSSWGDALPSRPVEDLAFGTAVWFARGGTYNAYYMWHGGTNFGRMAGYRITTSYDYDAPLDEYGQAAEPKHSHLAQLNKILADNSQLLLSAYSLSSRLVGGVEAVSYGKFEQEDSLVFLINNAATGQPARVEFFGVVYKLPRWSVTILKGPASHPTVLYNTATLSHSPVTQQVYTPIEDDDYKLSMTTRELQEPVGVWDETRARYRTVPMEQLFLTRDKSDYLWYSAHSVSGSADSTGELTLEEAEDFVCVHWNSQRIGCQQGGKNLTFQIPPSHNLNNNNLTILTQTLGLTNFGPHRQLWNRGLLGQVRLNGQSLLAHGWAHQPGLLGEQQRYFDPSADSWKSAAATVNSHHNDEKNMIWYRLQFPALPKGMASETFALDLSAMGKGQLWVNGHHLGRYWNITGKLPQQPSNPYPHPQPPVPPGGPDISALINTCDYAGVFYADKCRGAEGEYTQRYYHIPADMLNYESAGDNYIVLFEELGGDVSGVRLNTVSRKPVDAMLLRVQ